MWRGWRDCVEERTTLSTPACGWSPCVPGLSTAAIRLDIIRAWTVMPFHPAQAVFARLTSVDACRCHPLTFLCNRAWGPGDRREIEAASLDKRCWRGEMMGCCRSCFCHRDRTRTSVRSVIPTIPQTRENSNAIKPTRSSSGNGVRRCQNQMFEPRFSRAAYTTSVCTRNPRTNSPTISPFFFFISCI